MRGLNRRSSGCGPLVAGSRGPVQYRFWLHQDLLNVHVGPTHKEDGGGLRAEA